LGVASVVYSGRGRRARSQRDWSSDVCSSYLDASVFKQTNQSILTAVDTFVENIHVIKDKTISTKQLGYRCLAVNISDLAAMGAVPRFYLVSVVITRNWEELDVFNMINGLS